MSESQKMLMQIALIKIAEMDRHLKEKLIKADWEEEMQYLRNQAYRQSFMQLAGI